jgi:Secretion system C-terminal sorting domain
MKKQYSILVVCLFFYSAAKSQVHCSETLLTTAPSINIWDWRTQFWAVNAYTNGGPGILTSVLSPFYSTDNRNLGDMATILIKDYEPGDGWELLKKNLGTPSGVPVANAYVVFYNKYTAKIRVFFLVTQTFSNVGTNSNSNALVSIYFNSSYQSNLLTTYSAPLLPLDQLRRDINIRTPNIFFNQLPYWLFSEFPVAYDPCTCGNEGQIRMELTLMDGANLSFDLNSVPYQSPVVNGQIDQSKDWVTSFSQFSGKVEGGLKATRSVGEAFGKLNDVVAKQTNVDLQAKLNSDLAGVKKVVDAVGSYASMIPVAGAVVSSVVSLFDFFSAGGSAAAGPSPVMIMNDFKAKGSITSEVKKNELVIAIPGSNQANVDPAIKPVYNNILGSFNLLETPEVKIAKGSIDYSQLIDTKYCSNNVDPGSTDNKEYFGKWPWHIQLQKNLKFVINPALNIDLAKSDIRAAFIIEDCIKQANVRGLSVYATNMKVDIGKGNGAIYRSFYHPINSLTEVQEKLTIGGQNKLETYSCSPDVHYVSYNGSWCKPTIYIKILARLKKMGATKPSEDIFFIAKYPVKIFGDIYNPVLNGLEDSKEEINLIDYYNYSNDNSIRALNTITVDAERASWPSSISLNAGGAIIFREGAAITPKYSIKVGGIYSPSAPSLQSLQATSIDVNNFCSSSKYNGANNQRNIASRQAVPEEVQILTKEEFFTFYPNPATNQVTFKYFIEEASQVRLSLVDLSGKPIGLLIDEYKEMGDYIYNFDSSSLPAGMYVTKFESHKLNRTEKLIVIR